MLKKKQVIRNWVKWREGKLVRSVDLVMLIKTMHPAALCYTELQAVEHQVVCEA